MTRDGASGAEGRAPPERSPAAPTAPPRPCRTGVEDVPAPGRRGHRAGSASRGCDEGGHAGRCQEGSVLGDKRRGRLEMRRELVSEWGAPGRAGGDALPAGRPHTTLAPAPRRPPRAWLVPAASRLTELPRILWPCPCRGVYNGGGADGPGGGRTCHWNQTSPCTPSRRKVTSCGEQEWPGDAVVPFLGELPETGWQC